MAVVAAESHRNMSEAIQDLKIQIDKQAQTDAIALATVSTIVQSLNRSLEAGLETMMPASYQAIVSNLADEIHRNVSAPLHARIDALIDTFDTVKQSALLAADSTSHMSQLSMNELSASLNTSIYTLNVSYNHMDTKQHSLVNQMSMMEDNVDQHSQQIDILHASIDDMNATVTATIGTYKFIFMLTPTDRYSLT